MGEPDGMPKISDERKDNMLGGSAIILLGILLVGSAIWGIVYDVYSMGGGASPVLFIILGVGTIVIGTAIFLHKPEAQTVAAQEAQQ